MAEIINDILNAFCQETVLIIAVFLGLILNLIFGKKFFSFSKPYAVTAVIIALISSLKIQIIPTYYAFNGAFVSNFYTVFFKILILLFTLAVLLISKNILSKRKTSVFDSSLIMLVISLAAITLTGVNDFLTMFVALALLGLSAFILTLFSKNTEGKKLSNDYFITFVISSIITLLGISYIYMAVGSLNFDVIYSLLNKGAELSPFFDTGCILCAIGLTFYICVIPFSNLIVNVFEKTNKNISLFISLIPILAGFGILSRLIVFIFQYTPMLQALLFLIGIFSIFKGTFGLLRQDNLYSFMGYSINVQTGFILLGFCLANPYAVSTSLFYILVCIVSVTGFSVCLKSLLTEGKIKSIPELRGLVYKNKPLAISLTIFLFSFAGLPVTGGFLAKIYIFGAIIKCTNLYLAFLGIIMLATVIGIYAYLRPIKEMFESNEKMYLVKTKFSLQKLTLFISATLLVTLCIIPDKLIQICQFIAYQL